MLDSVFSLAHLPQVLYLLLDDYPPVEQACELVLHMCCVSGGCSWGLFDNASRETFHFHQLLAFLKMKLWQG